MLGYWYVKCFFSFDRPMLAELYNVIPLFQFSETVFRVGFETTLKNLASKASSSLSPKYLPSLKESISMCLNVYVYIYIF